ncbi:MAG: tetratricopeptide repeat protein, partial [Myxococcales bacterium]|nr:tetratricopeptide repeat protein [Myxococcales bacterium]
MRVVPFALAAVLSFSFAFFRSSPPFASAQESEVASLKVATGGGPRSSDPVAILALGRALRRAGQLTEAMTELRRGLGYAGGRPDVLTSLRWEIARVHMDRRDFFGMLAACGALGKMKVAEAEGHACTADAHLVWQRATEALTETAKALALDPSCYEAKIAEGRAYDFEIDPVKSQEAFRTAIGWRPDAAEGHLGLGRALIKDGKKEDGIAELRKAVSIDPSGPDGLYELAVALPPGDESAGLLERATRERPGFADAWIALGTQRLSGGHIAEAKRAAESAARNDAKNVAPHVLLGKVALADGRLDDAKKEGETALKITANSAPAKLLVADADAKKGEIDRALEGYQAAWGLDHGDPTPLVHAAEACHAAGRDTSARAFGVKVTEEFPHWGPGWAALGDALVGQKEPARAREAYTRALSADGPV